MMQMIWVREFGDIGYPGDADDPGDPDDPGERSW